MEMPKFLPTDTTSLRLSGNKVIHAILSVTSDNFYPKKSQHIKYYFKILQIYDLMIFMISNNLNDLIHKFVNKILKLI